MLADPSDRPDASALPTVAVVLAGGTGSRLGLDIPKQLVKIAGKTVLEHTVAILDAAPDVDEILVLMAAGYEREAEDLLQTGRFPKISAVLAGGEHARRDDADRPRRDPSQRVQGACSTMRCARC